MGCACGYHPLSVLGFAIADLVTADTRDREAGCDDWRVPLARVGGSSQPHSENASRSAVAFRTSRAAEMSAGSFTSALEAKAWRAKLRKCGRSISTLALAAWRGTELRRIGDARVREDKGLLA